MSWEPMKPRSFDNRKAYLKRKARLCPTKPCACGLLIPEVDTRGVERRYASGHNAKTRRRTPEGKYTT